MRSNKIIQLAPLVALLVAGGAHASVAVQYSFTELVGVADEIVHARVVQQESVWDEQTIVTRVELEIIDCLAGPHAPGDHITVIRHGGRIGDLAMVVPGAATFADAEEVVLFLESSPTRRQPFVVGLAQGKFSVVRELDSGVPMVTRDLTGLTLVGSTGELVESPAAAAPPEPVVIDRVYWSARPDWAQPADRQVTVSIPEQLAVGRLWVPLDEFLSEIRRAPATPGGPR